MRIEGGMNLIMGTSVLNLSMMIIMGVTKAEDNMIIKTIWVILIVTIIMLMRLVIWKRITIVMIGKPKETEEVLSSGDEGFE